MGRFIALMILVIPGIIAGYGIKLMRDAIFTVINSPYPNYSVQFLVGLILFIVGLGFIGGFIFYRDKKNGKIAPRFKNK